MCMISLILRAWSICEAGCCIVKIDRITQFKAILVLVASFYGFIGLLNPVSSEHQEEKQSSNLVNTTKNEAQPDTYLSKAIFRMSFAVSSAPI